MSNLSPRLRLHTKAPGMLCIFMAYTTLLFGVAHEGIFKEYDIRGVVGKEFTEEDGYDMTRAITTYLTQEDAKIRTIALGADGRIHSPAIKSHVTAALLDHGFNVIDIGTCTTPVMYYAMHATTAEAGLMITASHNPGEYNGIKICQGKAKVSGAGIRRIRELYLSQQHDAPCGRRGSHEKIDLISAYIDHLAALFPHLVGASVDAIVDCGNGAAGTVLPQLVKKMKWDRVRLLYPEVDGSYPHHIADPSVEENMHDCKMELLTSDAAFGLGFDGDCDRMAPMAKSGRLIKGDQLVAIYSHKLLTEHPGGCIVFDISSSQSLHDVVRSYGGIPMIAATGIVHVKSKMDQTGSLLGGEISCHTIFTDRYLGFDDGVYSMMRLFELLQATEKTLDEYLDELPMVYTSPLYRLPCQRALCFEIIEALKLHYSSRTGTELITLDGLRLHTPDGWAIIRPSNTEPVISIRFEGRTEAAFAAMQKDLHALISPFIECEQFLNHHPR